MKRAARNVAPYVISPLVVYVGQHHPINTSLYTVQFFDINVDVITFTLRSSHTEFGVLPNGTVVPYIDLVYFVTPEYNLTIRGTDSGKPTGPSVFALCACGSSLCCAQVRVSVAAAQSPFFSFTGVVEFSEFNLTVRVLMDSVPPVYTGPTAVYAYENSPNGTFIANLTALNVNLRDTTHFSIVSGAKNEQYMTHAGIEWPFVDACRLDYNTGTLVVNSVRACCVLLHVSV